ncbi:PREDICTED: uncharacterized protein LOC105455091, partial [Wasmannia auropunctata]|uniref:uncharacterized protein LOC105455091 n=1 Tax=Wasmannia auropunctata TaxID=64793 RepID=UPI0005F053C7
MSKEKLKNIPKHLMEDTTDIESDKNARQLSNKTREKDDIDEKERQENVRRILQKKVSPVGATVLTENLINRKNPSVELIRHEPLLKKRKIVDDENKDANKK